MRFIVSPAKTMSVVDDECVWRALPAFIDRTEVLAEALCDLSFDQAKTLWQCSDALAERNFDRHRAMDVRASALTPAVFAYDGIQYQHLAARVMTSDQLEYIQEHLRILSGFYGVLRPFDGVIPYRLEMQAKLGIEGASNLYEFWRDDLYRVLSAEAATIVNLASVEYARAVVPHAEQAAAKGRGPRVVTCLFGSVDARGRFVQRATAAKAARGMMVRWCAVRGVAVVDELRAFDVGGYAFCPERSTEDCWAFVHDGERMA